MYLYIYTHVNHIIHCQCHQVVGLLPTASSCFDRCPRRSYGWHADLRYGGSTRRKDDRSTTCTTKNWIWKLKFWKQNGLFQNQFAECLGTLRLAGEFLWRCGGQWAQRRPLQGGAKVTLSIGHVFFWCFFPFFLFICLYGSDTNSCGLVVRCWWRISCVQAPCQRCNWRNMEWYMNNIWISWNVYLTRSFGWKFEGAKVAKTCSAGGSDADGWPPVRQMLAWVLWCGAGWISAAERIANVWA